MNMGQTWPDVNDMAANGRLNSFTFYTFAENISDSPWEPYAVEKGFKPEDSAVMVAVAGMGEITTIGGGAVSPWTEQSILDTIISRISSIRGTSVVWTGVYTVVMHPECAKRLSAKGMSKDDVQKYLWEK